MEFVLNNSCCHDFDMLNWLLPNAMELVWDTMTWDDQRSAVEMVGKAVYTDGDTTLVSISYCKAHPSYVQRVTIDGQCFGYDFVPAEGQLECEIYAPAYIALWHFFAACCDVADSNKIAGERAKPVETATQTLARLASYAKTFSWLRAAQEALKG